MSRWEHVANQWDEAAAPTDPVDLLIYRSNLLGADPRITNYGGGNTSAKVESVDPITGRQIPSLWIKGSGGNLGSLTRPELAVLDNDRIVGLEAGYKGQAYEDDQARLLSGCLLDANGPAPSIDTPLHAVISKTHVDHVHPDAVIAFAAAVDGRRLVRDVFGDDVGWLDWQRPGFALAIRLRDLIKSHPQIRGVVLGGHGLISWADTSKACYDNTLSLIERATAALRERSRSQTSPSFGQPAVTDLDPASRLRQAAMLMPILRAKASSKRQTIGHFRDDTEILEFAGSAKAQQLVRIGTSCPDHFLRTKQRPLLLELPANWDVAEGVAIVAASFDKYAEDYSRYYRENATDDTPEMRPPVPVVVLCPGLGMITLAGSKQEARIASEFYVNAINVMHGAELLGAYVGLTEHEAFRVEYWALEEAKLRRMPKPRPLSGRVALITGGAGGIGTAIARRFVAEGGCVVIADIDVAGASSLAQELGEQASAIPLDVTEEAAVESAFFDAALAYGGVDILVNNAGISLSKPLIETTAAEFDRLNAVINRGSFLMSRAFARRAIASSTSGEVVYIVSKNAVFAGPKNIAYSTAKAAQLHQMRLLAAELAPHDIRVNAVNPDAVIEGSKIFAGDWGRDRAAAYGVAFEELGEYYAQRTLLKREVRPDDVAAACFVLVGGELSKTTGMVIPVDSGIAAAFLR